MNVAGIEPNDDGWMIGLLLEQCCEKVQFWMIFKKQMFPAGNQMITLENIIHIFSQT